MLWVPHTSNASQITNTLSINNFPRSTQRRIKNKLIFIFKFPAFRTKKEFHRFSPCCAQPCLFTMRTTIIRGKRHHHIMQVGSKQCSKFPWTSQFPIFPGVSMLFSFLFIRSREKAGVYLYTSNTFPSAPVWEFGKLCETTAFVSGVFVCVCLVLTYGSGLCLMECIRGLSGWTKVLLLFLDT